MYLYTWLPTRKREFKTPQSGRAGDVHRRPHSITSPSIGNRAVISWEDVLRSSPLDWL